MCHCIQGNRAKQESCLKKKLLFLELVPLITPVLMTHVHTFLTFDRIMRKLGLES